MIKIESTEARIEFETLGAQMTSFKLKETGQEYLWQPQEGFWQGRNPILFPLVAQTADKILHINGKEYTTGNHGFARHSEFEVVEQKESAVTFRLSSSEETLKQYPFDFDLEVTYTLKGKEVEISYLIRNRSAEMMPFTFGLHPAFSCPFEEGETLTDTYLEFTNAETQQCRELRFDKQRRIALSEELFEEVKTLLFENCASSSVALTDGKKGVRVSFVGYRWIAFWKQPQSKFVCIEPWMGHGDFDGVIREFKDREGMIHLEPGRCFTTEYKIAVF